MRELPQTTVIRVAYRFIDGLHIYTSEDVYGLYVADRDAQRAYERVAPSLARLIELNEGLTCKVEPSLTYSELVQTLHHPERPLQAEATSRSFLVRTA